MKTVSQIPSAHVLNLHAMFAMQVMADYHLAPFFEGVDMKRQRNKQAQFLSFAFGGPTKWTGPAMFAVHAPLIRDRGMKLLHFNRVITHLLDTLLELKVPQADVSWQMAFKDTMVSLASRTSVCKQLQLHPRLGCLLWPPHAGMTPVSQVMIIMGLKLIFSS